MSGTTYTGGSRNKVKKEYHRSTHSFFVATIFNFNYAVICLMRGLELINVRELV